MKTRTIMLILGGLAVVDSDRRLWWTLAAAGLWFVNTQGIGIDATNAVSAGVQGAVAGAGTLATTLVPGGRPDTSTPVASGGAILSLPTGGVS